MLAALSAWPGWGRIGACSSGASTLSVPSSASRVIAAVMSAVVNRRWRSAMAITSMPSMPSVPLMRARPSFSSSSTGSMPAAASSSPEGLSTPSGPVATPSPIRTSAQCESGARSPEQPSEPNSRTTGVMPAVQDGGHGLGDHRAYAGPAGGQRLHPQEHQRADHLALHRRAHPGGVRTHQRALQLGAELGADVPDGERAEAGGDAVDGARLGREGLDPGPRGRHLGERVRTDLYPGVAPGDGQHVLGADVGLADLDEGRIGGHSTVHIHMHHHTS